MMTPQLRRLCATLCALWVLAALVRLGFWAFGHSGGTASLTLQIIGGAAGAVGLAALALGDRDRTQP